MEKSISVIIVPHDNSRTFNLKFSYRLLYLFGALVAVLLISMLVFMFTYGRILYTAQQSARLAWDNKKLRHQAAQIDSLKLELVNLQAFSIQIKGMLGVELSRDDSLLVANFSPETGTPAIVADDIGEGLESSEQKRMLEAMPSLWPVRGYTTRGFHITGGEKSEEYHPGIDIAAAQDTPIKAAGEGLVVTSGYDETYGYVVEIDHGYGIYTLYGHNDRNLVKVGDRVSRGDPIAFLGSTGKSTAPHLHFEIRKNGIPVDPKEYLLDY
jgi:murein DD-endopeptidase MepM/ murein hydrolase activator NlpD